LLDPFYYAIAWVMKQWHALFSTFLDPNAGITWALSIVFLVVTIRIILFRFFIRQVKSQRAMQEIQPEMQKLKAQYGADRQGFSQAVMKLQKERGVNPLAGCLPLLPQIPVFIALLHVLRRLAPGKPGLYSWDDELTHSASVAKLFGAPISASFNMSGAKETAILAIPGVTYTNIRVVAMILIVIMCITTYTTQRQIIRKSGPVEGQAAMVQKFMLYGMPLSLFVSGFLFPIGVLIYWFTNNLWTLGQQFYILRKMPPSGSPAAQGKGAPEKAVDGRTLAPRPGAKPVRNRPQAPSTAPSSDAAPGDAEPAGSAPAADAMPAADATPSAGGATAAGGNGRARSEGSRPSANGSPSNGGGQRAGAAQGPANRGKRKRR
jgi:YidC/Oxa1 family membrane protein insertase